MVVDTGKFILMSFGNLIWPGLRNLLIGGPMVWISSPITWTKDAIARWTEER